MDARPPFTFPRVSNVEDVVHLEGWQNIIGRDEANVDDKGRILVSKKKRERLGSNFTLSLGTLGNLNAYPRQAWNGVLNEIYRYDRINQGRERFSRLILGLAEDEIDFDAQGRMVIPKKLRELAKLTGPVVLIGCGDRLEIWAEDEWNKYNEFPDVYGRQRREAVEEAYSLMTKKEVA